VRIAIFFADVGSDVYVAIGFAMLGEWFFFAVSVCALALGYVCGWLSWILSDRRQQLAMRPSWLWLFPLFALSPFGIIVDVLQDNYEELSDHAVKNFSFEEPIALLNVLEGLSEAAIEVSHADATQRLFVSVSSVVPKLHHTLDRVVQKSVRQTFWFNSI
jgi:hypothetical protein